MPFSGNFWLIFRLLLEFELEKNIWLAEVRSLKIGRKGYLLFICFVFWASGWV